MKKVAALLKKVIEKGVRGIGTGDREERVRRKEGGKKGTGERKEGGKKIEGRREGGEIGKDWRRGEDKL